MKEQKLTESHLIKRNEMEKERKKPKPFKVNEDRIYANKFYPYYFTEDLRVNVVPVKFYTRYQAKLTLKGNLEKIGINISKLPLEG